MFHEVALEVDLIRFFLTKNLIAGLENKKRTKVKISENCMIN
jgi:hypothetical protein